MMGILQDILSIDVQSVLADVPVTYLPDLDDDDRAARGVFIYSPVK